MSASSNPCSMRERSILSNMIAVISAESSSRRRLNINPPAMLYSRTTYSKQLNARLKKVYTYVC